MRKLTSVVGRGSGPVWSAPSGSTSTSVSVGSEAPAHAAAGRPVSRCRSRSRRSRSLPTIHVGGGEAFECQCSLFGCEPDERVRVHRENLGGLSCREESAFIVNSRHTLNRVRTRTAKSSSRDCSLRLNGNAPDAGCGTQVFGPTRIYGYRSPPSGP
jgi:hypothetical protein